MNKTVQILILFFSLSMGILSCKNGTNTKNSGEPPIPVNLYEVKREIALYYDSYPATGTALKEVEIRGEVTGYITGIYFNEGQPLHKGQKLYEIDRSKYAATLEEAKANVEIAQANLVRVQRDADRYTQLNKEDAIAKQRLDDAMTDVQNARLQVVSTRAELVKAQTDLDYAIIIAPFDGTIGISKVKIGTLITPGQTLLNTISSDDPMGVDFVIDEKELNRFVELDKKIAPANDTTFRITLPDNTLYPFSGKISLIDRAVDPQTGTIKVRLIFPNPDRLLKPGMSCDVRVMNANRELQIVIPYKAVVEQMGEYFVFQADGKNAKQLKISLGPKVGSRVIVRNGLSEGVHIIIDGIQKLHDGSPLLIGEAQMEGNKSSK